MLGSQRVSPEKVSEEMGTAREKSAVEGQDTRTPASSTENREHLQSAKKEQGGTDREGASAKTDASLGGGRGGGRGSGHRDTRKCSGQR